jgi:hypothetical protein
MKDKFVLQVLDRTKDVFLKQSESSLSLEIWKILQDKWKRG